FPAFIYAGTEQGAHAGRRAGESRRAALFVITESAAHRPGAADLAGFDILRAFFRNAFRHLEAGVASGSQGHDLTHRYRNVRLFLKRAIPPAALTVLASDNELHRPVECLADLAGQFFVRHHAVALGEEERTKAVAVHRPL